MDFEIARGIPRQLATGIAAAGAGISAGGILQEIDPAIAIRIRAWQPLGGIQSLESNDPIGETPRRRRRRGGQTVRAISVSTDYLCLRHMQG